MNRRRRPTVGAAPVTLLSILRWAGAYRIEGMARGRRQLLLVVFICVNIFARSIDSVGASPRRWQ